MTTPPDLLGALLAALRPEPVPDASLHDLLATHARLLEELHHTRRLLVEATQPPPAADADPLTGMLRQIHGALMLHPIAAQALYSALVAEGRRFAETEEGAALLTGLRHSPTLTRMGPAWEVISAGLNEPDAGVTLPSAWVDALVGLSERWTPEALVRGDGGGGW